MYYLRRQWGEASHDNASNGCKGDWTTMCQFSFARMWILMDIINTQACKFNESCKTPHQFSLAKTTETLKTIFLSIWIRPVNLHYCRLYSQVQSVSQVQLYLTLTALMVFLLLILLVNWFNFSVTTVDLNKINTQSNDWLQVKLIYYTKYLF